MSKNQTNYELKHRPFVVLGLIAENPNGDHAYSINKKIEDRGMRNWTSIGVDFSLSTIYRILEKFKKAKLVVSYLEEVDNRERRVYKITDYGFTILKNKIFGVLKTFFGKKDEDFYVAYSMFPFLSKEEQIEAFTTSVNTIRIHKEELEKMLEKNSMLPINVTGLFKHPIKILQTDIEFLEWVLKEIKEGKNNFDPKAYGK